MRVSGVMNEKPVHTNRLINEKSPYLLQHAHNPIDWYPWGEEAFKTAKEEDRTDLFIDRLCHMSLVSCDGGGIFP